MAKQTKTRPFEGIFTALEKVDGEVVLFGERGEPSVFFEIENPVQQLCTDASQYEAFHSVLTNLVQIIGQDYAIQKQDVLCRQKFSFAPPETAEFLTRSYFRYFNGREYTAVRTFLILTQAPPKGRFVKYNPETWLDFIQKVSKMSDLLKERGIAYRKLELPEVKEYLHRYMGFNFRNEPYAVNNMRVSEKQLRMADRALRAFSIVDIDEVALPGYIKPYTESSVNGYYIATDLFSFLSSIPNADCVIYNQVIQVPNQRMLLRKLQQKSKRHASMPDPSNKVAKADIDTVLEKLAVDSSLLVDTNFSVIVSCRADLMAETASFIEAKLYDIGILPSHSAYNQLELFRCCFPGNAYSFAEYDLFLTLAESALCLFYKEHMKHSEETPLKVWYTDRQGLPVCIDITGKEGAVKMTDNANFFCIGPSGSGKSFHMNSVVRQLLEQGTDVVMVDTGDSYEGICDYFQGTYISYSKEHPISMNPFKITDVEYTENFGEKKNFLKSLIFLIFKGQRPPTKIEEKIINQTLTEYYDEYFHPFHTYTSHQREELRKLLMLEDKKNGCYEEYSSGFRSAYSRGGEDEAASHVDPAFETRAYDLSEEKARKRESLNRRADALQAMIKDEKASEGEKANARTALVKVMGQLMEDHYLQLLDKKIDDMERKRRDLKVRELSFNSYYEYALERIPQITSEKKIHFNIHDFASILEPFYRGHEMDHMLNSDLDTSLFDEKFIVFEIDKIKDDPILFPIVVLIIMDVFLQKMRIKKGRKALIIEEAWKAIASPTMAEYIKYLYKTVRKFHGIAGVVTQELNDVIDSPIVKEAIINNSDIKILLDQSKFRDRYDEIASILGLSPLQRQQIFTVNALDNHDGRNFFREVWICRGQTSDVFGVEEPPECYWAYTTERAEKEALKIYRHYYGDFQEAISAIERDRKKAGINRYLDFARKVNQHAKVMSLWND